MNSLGSGYRLFVWPWWKHWFSPNTYYYWMKFKIQRAQRGWADCDTWSLDHYLAEWLPDALAHLKKNKHGIPSDIFTEQENSREDPEGWIGPDAAAMERAEKEWDSVLNQIIEAFRAHQRMHDSAHGYEKELGPWPMCPQKRHFLCDCQPYRAQSSQYIQDQKPLIARDQNIFEHGMVLFAKHFGSLWD